MSTLAIAPVSVQRLDSRKLVVDLVEYSVERENKSWKKEGHKKGEEEESVNASTSADECWQKLTI